MMKFIPLILALTTSVSFAVCPDGKTYPVTLTFDDGPHPALTPRVLDVLDAEKVKGTFFVLGERFTGGKSNPANKKSYAILDRMKRAGHTIGSHTFNHLRHPGESDSKIRENIFKPNELLKDYLSPVLRLPYGAGAFKSNNPEVQRKNDYVMNTVKKAGFKHVLWDIDTNDWDPKRKSTILPTMLNDICSKKGGVILFHDIQANTVDHLQDWIRAIKAQGHQIVGLEKFVPEAAKPFKGEDCQLPTVSKQVDELGEFINQMDELGDFIKKLD